jgi:hypothetical protein
MMRAFVAGMIAVSASIALANSAPAQTATDGYRSMQAQVGPTPYGDALSRTIGRDNPAIYSRSSPIYGGFDHQPTEYELRASRQQDVSGKQAREVDELYNQLMSTGPQSRRRHPAKAP